MAKCVKILYRAIIAICKHIDPQEALAGAGVAVRVEEAAKGGVIISTLEIVEACLGIEVITTVTQGVDLCKAAGCAQDIAPGVIAVLGIDRAALIIELYYVALRIGYIMEGVIARDAGIPILPHGKWVPVLVVQEIQAADKCASGSVGHSFPDYLAALGHVLMPQAICNLDAAIAGHVVLIVVGLAALGNATEPAALDPGQPSVFRAVVPVDRVTKTARRSIADILCYIVVCGVINCNRSQTIGPIGVSVGITDRFGHDVVYFRFNRADIAGGINAIGNNRRCRRRARSTGIALSGFSLQLVQLVVAIFRHRTVVNRIAGKIGLLDDRNQSGGRFSD